MSRSIPIGPFTHCTQRSVEAMTPDNVRIWYTKILISSTNRVKGYSDEWSLDRAWLRNKDFCFINMSSTHAYLIPWSKLILFIQYTIMQFLVTPHLPVQLNLLRPLKHAKKNWPTTVQSTACVFCTHYISQLTAYNYLNQILYHVIIVYRTALRIGF